MSPVCESRRNDGGGVREKERKADRQCKKRSKEIERNYRKREERKEDDEG